MHIFVDPIMDKTTPVVSKSVFGDMEDRFAELNDSARACQKKSSACCARLRTEFTVFFICEMVLKNDARAASSTNASAATSDVTLTEDDSLLVSFNSIIAFPARCLQFNNVLLALG
ncbi:MAG: hypothetical protein BWY95_01371 [Bacteroidetes bacterium ADurb.BinA104]|nr:MAG: hypothetical protein BWY95_01371 [Bacteroidetes bacterium ADurb.BinA104]